MGRTLCEVVLHYNTIMADDRYSTPAHTRHIVYYHMEFNYVVWSCRKLAEVLAELTAAIAHRILMHSAMQVKYEPLNTTAQATQGKHVLG